jgi:hypothetical protein
VFVAGLALAVGGGELGAMAVLRLISDVPRAALVNRIHRRPDGSRTMGALPQPAP